MKTSSVVLVFAAAVAAAPGLRNNHHSNAMHNQLHRRSGPLLHEDLLALYSSPTTSTAEAEAAAATATAMVANGPYTGPHGGNPAADETSTGAATVTSSAAAGSDETALAAASRPMSMYSHAYDTVSAAKSVPVWAIAVAVVLSVSLLAALAAFFIVRRRRAQASKEVVEPKLANSISNDKEDALSSYKAFWEAKRKSAGSFTSADANPAAVAADLVAGSLGRDLDLPRYTPVEARTPVVK